MWTVLLVTILLQTQFLCSRSIRTSLFKNDQIIFSTNSNIVKILVPTDGMKYLLSDTAEIPSIFFTVSDPKLDGGTCIYVLEGFAAYEVLEGGRDSTSDFSSDRTIYFGGKDGLYTYDHETLSARKYGRFKEDIVQLQKANGTDEIVILNSDGQLFKMEKSATIRTRIQSVGCASEFVLDTSNNIYYVGCDDKMPHIIKADGNRLSLTASVIEEFNDIKLLRPPFIMDNAIPFFGDGYLYVLHSNGSYEKKDFRIKEKPSAFSIDAALYLVAALNGKIYEFNVMDVMVNSMFGIASEWPRDVTKIIMSIIEMARDGIFDLSKERLTA